MSNITRERIAELRRLCAEARRPIPSDPRSSDRADKLTTVAREWLPMLLDENERLKKQAADLRDEIGSRVPNQQYLAALATRQASDAPFQHRVADWMIECFGAAISQDKIERNHRFIEEALELVQACGCTKSEAHQLVDYVYDRPLGDVNQEVGGVMVTLAALCLANGFDMHSAGETELARVWQKIDKIRAKQAAKPRHSPLPQASAGGEGGKYTLVLVADVMRARSALAALDTEPEGLETTAEERAFIGRLAADGIFRAYDGKLITAILRDLDRLLLEREAVTAVKRLDARQGEDVEAWAATLAGDLVAAGEAEREAVDPPEPADAVKAAIAAAVAAENEACAQYIETRDWWIDKETRSKAVAGIRERLK